MIYNHSYRQDNPYVSVNTLINGHANSNANNLPLQTGSKTPVGGPVQLKENLTGMPDTLKTGLEDLSGMDMSKVRVHYNSSKPGDVSALAYTQGMDIHVAPGQEKHLPHEAWHVVQQAQGRVEPTMGVNGVSVNDDIRLEQEADMMGGKAAETRQDKTVTQLSNNPLSEAVLVKNNDPNLLNPSTPVKDTADEIPIQCYMRIGQVEYRLENPASVPASSNVRGLLTDVQTGFHHFGLTVSAQGLANIRAWCADPELRPRAFNNIIEVVTALGELGCFYSREKDSSPGPSTLGDRPSFSGEANKLPYGKEHGDTARRHVISSSTLGLAIEMADTTRQQINGFLERHGRQAIAQEGELGLRAARRSAWELVHNHIGNLWVGPSPVNTAIGFVRSVLANAINYIRRTESDILIGNIAEMITRPKGPMDQAAQAEWRNFTIILNSALTQVSDPKTGVLNKPQAVELLLSFSRNADLDLPPGKSQSYNAGVRFVYASLLGTLITGNDIFEKDGTLDQFMRLDTELRKPVLDSSSKGTDAPSDFSSSSADKKLTVMEQVPAQVEGRQVRNVTGDGLNCLIRALLVAAGDDRFADSDPGNLVGNIRQRLNEQGFAQEGRMLDLAGASGAMVISILVHENILAPNRGLILYQRNSVNGAIQSIDILDGGNPIRIWLNNEHFRAIR